jgi:hypothetical protein
MCEERRRKVDHLSSGGFYLPVYVLNREFDGDHHHPPAAVPEDNRPDVRAIQYMPRNVRSSVLPPDSVVSHFVVGVEEPYVSVPVDGFTCSHEVDNSADGPVDQLSLNEVLKLPLVKPLVNPSPKEPLYLNQHDLTADLGRKGWWDAPYARTFLTFSLMISGAISLLSSLMATLMSTGSPLSSIPAVSWDL